MQSFKIVAYLLLGYFWLVEGEEELLKLKAFLASAEVSAGAVAKADQYPNINLTTELVRVD
jgi:hypothetical protein